MLSEGILTIVGGNERGVTKGMTRERSGRELVESGRDVGKARVRAELDFEGVGHHVGRRKQEQERRKEECENGGSAGRSTADGGAASLRLVWRTNKPSNT